MQSTLTKQADPHDVFLIESVLAECAKLTPREPADRDVSPPLAPQVHVASEAYAAVPAPSVDTTFRATAVEPVAMPRERLHNPLERNSNHRWLIRTAFGFVFALVSAVAAAAWQHYGDAARQTIARWTPLYAQDSSPVTATQAVAYQPPSPANPAAATDEAAEPAAASTQPAPDTAPALAAAAPEPAALPASVARDIAAMGQQIEDLKATIAQLKAGQEQMARQMSRDIAAVASEAKASEQAAHARLVALPPRPAPLRKPKPVYAPMQTSAVPIAPAAPPPPPAMAAMPLQTAPQAQPAAEPDGEPVVRPPMPLR
jgi:hypothetical protein